MLLHPWHLILNNELNRPCEVTRARCDIKPAYVCPLQTSNHVHSCMFYCACCYSRASSVSFCFSISSGTVYRTCGEKSNSFLLQKFIFPPELLFSVCDSSLLSILCKPLFQCKMDLNGTRSKHSENSYKWPLTQASDQASLCVSSGSTAVMREIANRSMSLNTGFCLLAL